MERRRDEVGSGCGPKVRATASLRLFVSSSLSPEPSLVLIRTVASRQLVTIVSSEARRRGVRIDMPLAEARALCPGLIDMPYEPEKDHRLLEALARWMLRFSPMVGVQDSGLRVQGSGGRDGETKRQRDEVARASVASVPCTSSLRLSVSPSLFLDLSGCERLYGGLLNLLEQVREAVAALGFAANCVIAPTIGAAWALASSGRDGLMVDPLRLRSFLDPLGVETLRLDPPIIGALHAVGLKTIGQVLAIPRDSLPARFGPSLLLRLDQVLGRVEEALTPVCEDVPIAARIDFDGPVDSLESLYLSWKRLIDRVAVELHRRGRGARRLDLELTRACGQPVHKRIDLSLPSRDPRDLFKLVQFAIDHMESQAARGRSPHGRTRLARDHDADGRWSDGFLALSLRVSLHEPLPHQQSDFLDESDHDARRETAGLVERLTLRLGESTVLRPRLVESYVPEKAWEGAGVRDEETKRRRDKMTEMTFSTSSLRLSVSPSLAVRFPLAVILTPQFIRVMVTPSHDLEGRPVSWTDPAGEVRAVAHCIGPERIAGQWWTGHDKTRDYFAVEDPLGRRHWIFRVRETRKWYWHGEYG